jgi:molecular chaperone GrpE
VTDEPRAAGGPAPAGEPDVTARSPAPEAAAAGKGGPAAGAGSGTPSAGKGGPAASAGSGTPSEGARSGRPSGSGEGTSAASGEGGEGAPDREDRPDASATGDAAADRPAGDAADPAGASGDPADGATDDIEVDADLQAAADALEVDLELLLSERAQYLDAYRRAQADFENYRKQAQRRQDDAVVRALGGFVERLLPVLDSCDAALAHGAGEVEPVLTALYGALSKEGLERIDPKGAPFDPIEAEAVVHEPGEGGDHVVAEVLRPGYRWRGKVLRPAMVKVTD